MYIFLSSKDCSDIYVKNNPWDFRVDLKSSIDLPGDAECALTEISFNKKKQSRLYVYCDVIESSNVKESRLPLLRVIQKSSAFDNPYYFDVRRAPVSSIRVYIRTETGQIPSLGIDTSYCTLHFREKT